MRRGPFTIIDDGKLSELDAVVSHDAVALSFHGLEQALGWTHKPEGLCKGDQCVPVEDEMDLISEHGIDLGSLAELLARPLALDLEQRVAYLGTSAAEQSATLAALEAPDFTLPDLEGKLHSLSDYRGKKVLLVAYASW